MHISTTINDLEIRIDKRTELLAIIEILSDYGKKYPFLLEKYGNKDYVTEIEEKFKEFKNHKVIQIFNDLTHSLPSFCFSTPIQLFLQLNEDFSFSNLSDDLFSKKLNRDSKVLELLSTLADFAKEIEFDTYYFHNEFRYRSFIHNIQSQLIGLDIVRFLNNYYGVTEPKHFIVNLIPWRTYGCYGTHQNNDLYTHLCCHHKSKKEDEIYPSNDHIFNYSSFLVHEFSHSFINPLTDKYAPIEKFEPLFNVVREKLRELGYGSTDSILKDHIVRAITLRYLLLERSDIYYYNKQLEIDENWGFIYVRDIMGFLCTYEENRNDYQNMHDFYPVLIQNLLTKKEKQLLK